MKREEIKRLAEEEGFANAAFLPVKELCFDRELRRYCEEDLCGNYDVNYACPPECGSPAEMEDKVRAYDTVLVLQTINEVEDLQNGEELKAIKKRHNEWSWSLVEKLREKGAEGLPVMAGPCSECRVCESIRRKPCRFPQKAASCLSAYCIQAEKMAGSCGLPYWCGENKVAFFSLYLMKEEALGAPAS